MKYKNTFSACLSTLLLISSVWPNISAAQTSSDGNWVIKNKMPIARAAMAVASSGSQIFLIGGSAKSDGTYGVNSDVDTSGDDLLTYDASTDSWTSRQTGLSPARSLGKAEIIN
ncbi:hypothetical protein HY224_02545, partial [Candidatus Uhrbacteria bacterium]|nr:hypothetical protein [Candidatus Uhrbacteria bacterium]